MHFLKKIFFLFIFVAILNGPSAASTPNNSTSQDTASSTILDDGSKPGASPLKGNIKIVGRQLQIDGQPFIMKGICYSPVRKGGIYPDGLITNNPTDDDLTVIEKDFQMMHAAGINTIRTYVPMVDPRILDLLTKYKLRTIVPVLNNHLTTFAQVNATILALKDHPSTLIWEVGNEWNYNFFYSQTASNPAGIGLDQSVVLLKNAAQYIRALDATHPISTVIGDLPIDTQFWSSLNFRAIDVGIDLYGINVYAGLTFGDRLDRWVHTSTKPLYISEFGADAYNMNLGPTDPLTGNLMGAEDDASQAFAVDCLVKQVLSNLSALDSKHVLVGSNLFEWNDEWWKPDNTNPNSHVDTGVPSPGCGPYPDDVFNEKWFGILDIDRNPRAAYYTLQQLYSKLL